MMKNHKDGSRPERKIYSGMALTPLPHQPSKIAMLLSSLVSSSCFNASYYRDLFRHAKLINVAYRT
jgi:hypothetical protein